MMNTTVSGAKSDTGEQVGAWGRIWRAPVSILRGLGVPVVGAAKMVGETLRKDTLSWTGNKVASDLIGEAGETATLVFGGYGVTQALKQGALKLSASSPEALRTIIASETLKDPALTAAAVVSEGAKARGADQKAVFQTLTKLGERMDPAMKESLEKAGYAGASQAAPLTMKGMTGKAGMTESVLNKDTVKAITDGATAALVDNFDKSKRVFQNIFELVGQNGFVPAELKPAMVKWGITPAQLAEEYAYTVSNAGKLLNYHSRVAKALGTAFEGDEGAQKVLAQMAAKNPELFEPTIGDYVTRAMGSTINFWRSMLTTQLATSVRNVIGGGANYSMEVLGSALNDVVAGTATMAKGQFQKGLGQMFTSINAAVRTGATLSLENRAQLMKVLDDPKAMEGLYKMRLISQPMGDLNLTNKLAWYANSANRFQEYFIRGAAAEFKLRTLLSNRGMNLDTIAGKDVPEDVLAASVDFARRVTFASASQPKWLGEFIRTWGANPVTTLINPFPNFTFGNAIPFVLHKSSLGVGHFLSRDAWRGVQKLATNSGPLTAQESERLGRVLTDAAAGTALWWSAWNMRQSDNAGEKWYEVKGKDGNYTDLRPFAPYSTFLFLSEFMQRPERIKWQDWTEAFMGMSRLGGTSLMFADLIRAKDSFHGFQTLKTFGGQFLGGMATPLRQFRDMVEYEMAPEDAILRDTKQDPLIGPLLNNLPYFNTKLPYKYSPLRAGELDMRKPEHSFEFMGREYKMSSLFLRQLTGISENTKTKLNAKVDELQLDPSAIFPRTGNAEADNLVAKAQGYYMQKVAGAVLPALDQQPKPIQDMLLKKLFAGSKAYGRGLLAATHPRLWNEVKALAVDEDKMQIMKELGGINPYQANDQELAKRGYAAPNVQRGAK